MVFSGVECFCGLLECSFPYQAEKVAFNIGLYVYVQSRVDYAVDVEEIQKARPYKVTRKCLIIAEEINAMVPR